jgi:hypothetical protein
MAPALASCTEDPILATNSETAPGFATPTIEVVLEAGELPAWRDTTYWGFVLPSTAAYSLSSDSETLRSRPLGRFSTIPDSLFVDTARVAIDSFTSAAIRLTIDTLASEIPAGGVELAAWSLSRSFDANEATWLNAREGEPWSTPGGDLLDILGTDSLSFEVDSLTALPDTEGLDTVLNISRVASPTTFIFDPPTPDPTTRLRLGGLPGARYYLDFELPDSLGFIELRGATINRATLEFRPTRAPDDPFELRGALAAQAVRLLADPFVYGEKTPIGSTLGDLESLNPDSLASGVTMQYDITSLIRVWTQIPSDSAFFPLRVGIVPVPENRQFGFWEFFSREDGPGLRPVVHLLFTPNPSFLLP